MHLLHWLVNEQVPQYYLISSIYASIRNKSVICVCMCANISIRTNTLFDYYTKITISRPIPNGLSALDAKTLTHSQMMRRFFEQSSKYLHTENIKRLADWMMIDEAQWTKLFLATIAIYHRYFNFYKTLRFLSIFINIRTVSDVDISIFRKRTFRYLLSDFSTLIFIYFSFLDLIFYLRVSKT